MVLAWFTKASAAFFVAALLFDAHLGWAGAWGADCGRAHLNWRRLHARATGDGLFRVALSAAAAALISAITIAVVTESSRRNLITVS